MPIPWQVNVSSSTATQVNDHLNPLFDKYEKEKMKLDKCHGLIRAAQLAPNFLQLVSISVIGFPFNFLFDGPLCGVTSLNPIPQRSVA